MTAEKSSSPSRQDDCQQSLLSPPFFPKLPPAARLDGAVLISGPALIHVERSLKLRLAALRRDGASTVPAVLAELTRTVTLAADAYRASMSASGHADIDFADIGAVSATATPQSVRMTTAEVAAHLQVTERHVRRVADEIGCATVAGRRVFDRANVEAYALGRAS